MNIHIAICDDEKRQREYMALLVCKWADNNSIRVQTSIYESAEQFKMMREESAPHDILLLDIQMGGQGGKADYKSRPPTNLECRRRNIAGISK